MIKNASVRYMRRTMPEREQGNERVISSGMTEEIGRTAPAFTFNLRSFYEAFGVFSRV
jgi:hypothetical protein